MRRRIYRQMAGVYLRSVNNKGHIGRSEVNEEEEEEEERSINNTGLLILILLYVGRSQIYMLVLSPTESFLSSEIRIIPRGVNGQNTTDAALSTVLMFSPAIKRLCRCAFRSLTVQAGSDGDSLQFTVEVKVGGYQRATH